MRSPRYSTRAQSSHVKEEEQHVYSTRSHNTSTLREHKLEKNCAPEESNHEQPRTRTRRSRRNDSPENGPDAPFNEQTDNDTPPRISTRSSRRQEEATYRRETRAQLRSEAVPIEGEADSRDNDSMDMYTRVKRVRRQPKRDMYGFILEHDEQGEKTTEDEESEENQQPGENEENEETEVSEEESQRQYNLRQNKPKTQFFSQASEVVKKRDRVQRSINPYFGNQTPPKHKSSRTRRYTDPDDLEYRSPAHRRHKSRRKRRAAHDRSSSSTSTSGSDNEKSFARRKKKSMAKARMRCLPMNLRQEDVTNITNDRQKIGASLADIDPMSLDRSVTFESVGGLTNHLRSLKEMVVFPLLYPEVFDKFSITPPRGVLFYGPPGTGKTLVARALANECSIGDKRVAFFMRKGADCLSKWVGESERQLRLLFDQAYQMRPSIIFFDEIDGLAPVRSSRQDQIHSSIVSTLLALMDGLDSRGEVVVIGATNRIDSIDPALRRPGRFDREFLFTLPNVTARTDILKIHTKDWKPLLLPEFLLELAQKSSGYCGADLKSLCTEAALQALRRRYPQIYESSEKLQLDLTTIQVSALDFHYALKSIAPAARRAVLSLCRPLSSVINPLLSHQLNTVCKIIERSFPHNKPHQQNNQISQYDSSAVQRSIHQAVRNLNIDETTPKSFFDFPSNIFESPVTYKPRLLISGNKGQAHDTHLTPAVLHSLEYLPQHCIDLTTLYNNTSVSADEACTQVFREARRCSPSVLYIPNIDVWWDSIHTTVQHNIIISINELYLHSNVLLIVSISEQPNIPQRISELFSGRDELYNITNPTSDQIREYFTDLILNQTKQPPPFNQNRELEVLPKAPPPAPSQLTEQEESALWEGEEAILRELRLFLRGILNKLASDRKFTVFTKPVDFEDVPDYYEIIKKPMDLSTIMSKIDLHEYQTCKQFLSDIDLICHNALEYNPPTSSAGRAIRHRACALKDTAYAMISNELDEEFEKQCESIVESRQRRGRTPSKSAPRYYHVQPDSFKCGRYSKRLRGETADLKTINDSLRHDRTLRHHDMPRHELHHEQHHDMKEHGDGETSLSAVKRKKRRRSNWSAGIIRKPKVSKSSPSKANRNQSETEDEEEKPDTQADDEVTFKVTGTEKQSNDEETESKPIESNCQLPSDEEMDDSCLIEYSGIRENGELESENTETVQNGEPIVEQAEPDRSSPEQSTSEITVEKSPEVHIPTDKQQGVKLVNGDTPTKSGDTPTKSGDTPTKSGDTPTKSGDTPTKAGGTPTKSGDTPTKSADMERENSPRKPSETILIIEPAEIEELEIDTQVLQDLLELVVTVTRDYNINKLEHLYSNITSLIFQHRYSYNKRLLTQEIEQLLHSYRVDNTD